MESKIQEICKKHFLNENEMLAKYKEFLKEATSIDKEAAPQMAYNRLITYIKKVLKSKAKKFEAVVVAVTDVTDYGSAKKYAETKVGMESLTTAQQLEQTLTQQDVLGWASLPEGEKKRILTSKKCDIMGNPIKLMVMKDGKLMVRKINPEADKQKTVYLVGKQVPDGTKVRKMVLKLTGKGLDGKVLVGHRYSFKAVIQESASTEEVLFLQNEGDIDFVERGTFEDFPALLREHYKDYLTTIEGLKEFNAKHDRNAFAIFKGAVTNITVGSFRTVLDVTGTGDNLDNFDVVRVLVNPDTTLDFAEGTPEVVMMGRVRVRQDTGAVEVYSYGCWTPDMYRINRPDISVTEESFVEEVVDKENSETEWK